MDIKNIEIRKAEGDDAPALSELMDQLGYSATSDEVRRRLLEIQSSGSVVFVAVEENQGIIGCIQAMRDVRIASGNFGEITGLSVEEKARGRKVGRRLIETAVSWVKSKGETRMRVRCNQVRKEAHRFYEAVGFRKVKGQNIYEKDC